VDIELRQEMEIGEVVGRLHEQLPMGIRLLEGQVLVPGAKALTAVLNRASYTMRIPMALPITPERLAEAIRAWLERKQVTYAKFNKKGQVEKDIRPWVKKLTGEIRGEDILLDLEVEVGNQGSVRPEEVAASLRDLENLPLDLDGLKVKRTGIFVQYQGKNRSPLDAGWGSCCGPQAGAR